MQCRVSSAIVSLGLTGFLPGLKTGKVSDWVEFVCFYFERFVIISILISFFSHWTLVFHFFYFMVLFLFVLRGPGLANLVRPWPGLDNSGLDWIIQFDWYDFVLRGPGLANLGVLSCRPVLSNGTQFVLDCFGFSQTLWEPTSGRVAWILTKILPRKRFENTCTAIITNLKSWRTLHFAVLHSISTPN